MQPWRRQSVLFRSVSVTKVVFKINKTDKSNNPCTIKTSAQQRPTPQVDPVRYLTRTSTDLHLVRLSTFSRPPSTDELRGESGVAGFLSFTSASHSFSLCTPTFNFLTTPWHLRVPGIRLKWERGALALVSCPNPTQANKKRLTGLRRTKGIPIGFMLNKQCWRSALFSIQRNKWLLPKELSPFLFLIYTTYLQTLNKLIYSYQSSTSLLTSPRREGLELKVKSRRLLISFCSGGNGSFPFSPGTSHSSLDPLLLSDWVLAVHSEATLPPTGKINSDSWADEKTSGLIVK